MMAAMIAGQRDPKVLAQLARARMRAKISQLEEAFVGRFSDHHAFLLTKMLARIDAIAADIIEVETRTRRRSPLSLRRWPAWTRSRASASPPPR
jgi:transposase